MDQSVQPYDKQCMKMAMLKHEQTFKEQVYELHRLYQIQKMLMKNMQNQENICFNYQQQKNDLDLEQPATKEFDDHVTETSNDQEIEEVNECEIELTLGPTSFNRRRLRMTNKPESSDSVPSFSSSSTGSSHIKRIERITRENSSYLSAGNRRNNSSSSDRSLKQPPWMYQVLSLNMT